MRRFRPGSVMLVLALLAVAMLCGASVQSATMQFTALTHAAASPTDGPMPGCDAMAADMPGMAMGAAGDDTNRQAGTGAASHGCPICAVAMLLPPPSAPVAPLRQPARWISRPEAAGAAGLRDPPPPCPVARGPPHRIDSA